MYVFVLQPCILSHVNLSIFSLTILTLSSFTYVNVVDSYEAAYVVFAASGTAHAAEAKLYIELHKEKYYDVPADVHEENNETLSEEEQLLRDHPCCEKGELEDGYVDERLKFIRQQLRRGIKVSIMNELLSIV